MSIDDISIVAVKEKERKKERKKERTKKKKCCIDISIDGRC
jgi:hypothetical protein